eukprot:403335268
MHRPDSQTQIINTYLQEIIKDPLHYEEVEYDKTEWDNIPWIIPRYCIHLSKHLQSITTHYKSKCEEESTQELRDSLTKDIEEVETLVYQERADRENSVQTVQDQIDDLKKSLEQLREKIQKDKFDNIIRAKQGLLGTFVKDEKERGRVDFESRRYTISEQQQMHDMHEMVEPRTFSIVQIREMFYALLHVSKFREAFWDHQEFFIKIRSEIGGQINEFKQTVKDQHEVNTQLQTQIDISKNEIGSHIKDYYKVLEQDHDSITMLRDKQKIILRELEDNKGFQDLCNSKFEKTYYRINTVNEKLDHKLESHKVKLEQLMKENDKKLFDLKDTMMQTVEVTKHHIYDQIDQTKDQITQVMRQELDNHSSRVEEYKDSVNERMKGLNTKTKCKISKIKDICTNFFKSYEDSLNQMKNQFIEVHDAFQSWNRNVVRPNEMKEAKLYSLEQRMNIEESQRLNDVILIRDVVNKFIFSMHQHIITQQLLQKNRKLTKDENITEFDQEGLNELLTQNLAQQKRKTQKNSNSQQRTALSKTHTALDMKQQKSHSSIRFLGKEQDLIDIEADNACKAAELLLAKRLLFLRQKLNNAQENNQNDVLTPKELPHQKRLIHEDSEKIMNRFKPRNIENKMSMSQQVSPKHKDLMKNSENMQIQNFSQKMRNIQQMNKTSISNYPNIQNFSQVDFNSQKITDQNESNSKLQIKNEYIKLNLKPLQIPQDNKKEQKLSQFNNKQLSEEQSDENIQINRSFDQKQTDTKRTQSNIIGSSQLLTDNNNQQNDVAIRSNSQQFGSNQLTSGQHLHQKQRIEKLKNLSLSNFEKSKFISDQDIVHEQQKLLEKVHQQNSKIKLKNLDYFGAIEKDQKTMALSQIQ